MDEQTTSVECTPEGHIRIRYEWNPNGVKMGGEFVFEAERAAWFVDCLRKAANDELASTESANPPDRLQVYIGGGHRYDDINVNAINERAGQAIYGRTYALSGMARETALGLADQIEACVGLK